MTILLETKNVQANSNRQCTRWKTEFWNRCRASHLIKTILHILKTFKQPSDGYMCTPNQHKKVILITREKNS